MLKIAKTSRRTSLRVSFWPGLLDLVTSVLMVFILTGYVQTILSFEDFDTLLTRQKQDRFIELFRKFMSEELDEQKISIARHLDFLQITFSDGVLFETLDYHLKPEGEVLLTRCADVLLRASSTGFHQIQVEGHTDNTEFSSPSYPKNNWELSTARALSVVDHLIVSGLPDCAFSANGYAEYRPVETNETKEGRALNRRIELRLFFTIEKCQEDIG